MTDVIAGHGAIPIGRQGENLVTRVVLPNLRSGAGSVILLHQRARDRTPYPVTTAEDGSHVYWVVSSADTAIDGMGRLELQWQGTDGEILKSRIWQTYCQKSLTKPGDPPEPWEDYIGDVSANAKAARDARDAAEQYAETSGNRAHAAASSALAAQESADDAAQSLQALEDGIASGDFKGEPGENAPQIDDAAISAENPWSSRHIVDMLCPPMAESGNPVVCYPVAGYPLGVVASWEPTQAGSGEPSPDNIRPIIGRETVSVERCGVNIANIESIFTITANSLLFWNIGTKVKVIPGVHYYVSYKVQTTAELFAASCGLGTYSGIYYRDIADAYKTNQKNGTIRFEFQVTEDSIAKIPDDRRYLCIRPNRYSVTTNHTTTVSEICVSITDAAAYVPYRGETLALALPSTIYGGTVDAVTGEGKQKWGLATFDGSEAWTIGGLAADKRDWYYVSPKIVDAINDQPKSGNEICSHYPHYDVENNNTGKGCALVWSAFRVRWGDIIPENTDVWKSYLAAQYAAGTPVQIAYKLGEPVPFQSTGNGPLLPIPGETNTITTDADSVTVTGRADPIKRILDLEDAVASMTT